MNLEALSVDWIKQYFNQILILSIGLAVTGMHILGTLFQIKFLKIDKTYIGLSDKFYMTRPLVETRCVNNSTRALEQSQYFGPEHLLLNII